MNRCAVRSAILGVFLAFFVSSTAQALANRVFLSARAGNDANACDNINTPCQTFAGAVTKLNPGGEAIVLESGGYGPVTLTKSLTIEAPPGVVAFIHPSSGDAVTINAASGDRVVLRGLVLNSGSGNGITVNTVGTLHVENCVISGFTGFGGGGILVNAAGSNVFIKDTVLRQNSDGIVFQNGRGSIDHCRVEGNSFAGVGVLRGDVTIRDSVCAGNGAYAFVASSVSSANVVLNVYRCIAANNGGGGLQAANLGMAPSVIARAANSSFIENGSVGLEAFPGATIESLGNNLVRGNVGGDVSGTITVVAPE